MKVRIAMTGLMGCGVVEIDGVPMQGVRGFVASAKPRQINTVTLEIAPSELEIEGEFEVTQEGTITGGDA